MILTKDKTFYKTLLSLAIPMVLQNLITFMVGFADNLMIGHLGDSAVSGVYMGNQLQTALQVLSAGIEGAVLLLSAQYWGKKDTASIRKIAAVGVSFSLLLGSAFTVVCALIPRQMIGIFTNESAVIEAGTEYLSILCYSFLFFSITQALIATMRGVENTKIGMTVSLISLGVNIVLNYIMIFGHFGFPAMGIRGAALATLVARITETAVIWFYVRFTDKKLGFRLRQLLEKNHFFGDFVRYGCPIIAGQLVWGCNLIARSMIIGRISAQAITAASLANTVNSITYICMNGLSGAVGIIIGKTVGSGNEKKVKEYSKTVELLFIFLGLITGCAFFLMRDGFISLYAISPESARLAREFITVLSVTIVGTCYECGCLFGLVKSGGDVGFVFKNDTIFVFLITIPLSVAALLLGAAPWMIFFCLNIDQILKCFVAFVKIRKYNWMKNLTRTDPDTPENAL